METASQNQVIAYRPGESNPAFFSPLNSTTVIHFILVSAGVTFKDYNWHRTLLPGEHIAPIYTGSPSLVTCESSNWFQDVNALAFKALNNLASSDIRDLPIPYEPDRCPTSFGEDFITLPKSRLVPKGGNSNSVSSFKSLCFYQVAYYYIFTVWLCFLLAWIRFKRWRINKVEAWWNQFSRYTWFRKMGYLLVTLRESSCRDKKGKGLISQ